MLKIDLMTESDVEGVWAVDKECFKLSWSLNSFYEEMKNELSVYFVAKEENEIVGYAGFWNVAGAGDITNVAVHPDYRRKGIASLLILTMIKKSRELNLSSLTLEVRESNIAAQNLYAKFGFSTIGRRKAFYSDNREDALIMSLVLGE